MVREYSNVEAAIALILAIVFLIPGLLVFILGGLYGFGSDPTGNVQISIIMTGVVSTILGICNLMRYFDIKSSLDYKKNIKNLLQNSYQSYQKFLSQHSRIDSIEERIEYLKSLPGMDNYIKIRQEPVELSQEVICPFCEAVLKMAKRFEDLLFCPSCDKPFILNGTTVIVEKTANNIQSEEVYDEVEFWIKLLESSDNVLKEDAIISLGEIGDERAIPYLEKLQDDESKLIRNLSKKALNLIKQVD